MQLFTGFLANAITQATFENVMLEFPINTHDLDDLV